MTWLANTGLKASVPAIDCRTASLLGSHTYACMHMCRRRHACACTYVQLLHRSTTANTRAGTLGLSEALALLDFMVLARARHFVGFGLSSFSWGVREYRCLLGSPPTSTSMPAISIPLWDRMGLNGATVLSNHSITCPYVEIAAQD